MHHPEGSRVKLLYSGLFRKVSGKYCVVGEIHIEPNKKQIAIGILAPRDLYCTHLSQLHYLGNQAGL
jgi:hypothetical protein